MPKQPELQTPRLILRPFALTDAADVQRLAGAPEVADTTLNVPHPYKDGMAEDWISSHAEQFASGTIITYAVALKGQSTPKDQSGLVGAVSLGVTVRHSRAELGYWIGVPFWNQGYATEASAALIEYGFDALGLHKITASHFVRNPASGRVMQKLGMTLEGTRHSHFLKGKHFEDVAIYGLLSERWKIKSR
jgi:ribosomal-protein-alanine N-acetyltransferase